MMIGRKTTEVDPETIETVIGPTADFAGGLKSDGGVRIEGEFEGSLETAGALVVGDKARVVADITADTVSVAGAIRGNMKANRVEVLGGGKVWGDMAVGCLLLDEGGFISGQINMQAEGLEPPRRRHETADKPNATGGGSGAPSTEARAADKPNATGEKGGS